MTLKIERPAVLLEGGPRDGWAYFEDEIEDLVRIEAYCGRRFDYQRTSRFTVHPRTNGAARSRVWSYIAPGRPQEPERDPWDFG